MISCGKCDKRYFKIFLLFLIVIIIILIIYVLFVKVTHINYNIITKSYLLKNFLKYFGMSLSFIPELILKYKSKSSKKQESIKVNNHNNANGFIEFIYTDLSDTMKFKDYLNIGFMSLLLLIIDFIKIVLGKKEYSSDSQYTFIELPFLLLISVFVFKINYYKHQYLSIIVITVIGFIHYIIKTIYYYKETSDLENIMIELSLLILIGLGESIFLSYTKVLMQFKFFSPYKVCCVFGLINCFIILILYFIISEFKCSKKSLLCDVEYKGDYYFDNIYFFINEDKISQKILLFLIGIFEGIIKLLYNIIINYFSVCHMFLFLQNKGIADSINADVIKQSYSLLQGIINCLYLIEIFFILVFLELLQLNFCGLNKNLKVNIQKRTNEDIMLTHIDEGIEEPEDTGQIEGERDSSFNNDTSRD